MSSRGRVGRKAFRRVAQLALSVVIVVAIFAYAVPRIADYSAVLATIRGLTAVEIVWLFAAVVLVLVTYWLANMAALPGLRLAQAAVVTQTTTSVANTLPAGGAVAVGLTYQILRSWGFSAHAITLYIGVTGVWNVFVKLALPVLSLALLMLTGQASPALLVASMVGLGVLAVAIALLSFALSSMRSARRIGDGVARLASWFRRPFGKPPLTGWGEEAVVFRRRTIVLIAGRWLLITATTIASQLALWLVLLLCLRHVGISEQEVTTLQTLAVFAFGRLLATIPVTPGGLGVIELGYIGGFVSAGGNAEQVVAAVLLFRALTHGIQIPIGAFTYVIWRTNGGWRREPLPDTETGTETEAEPEPEPEPETWVEPELGLLPA